MELRKEITRRVESFDADLHNTLKISSIFNYMQDIAAKHADELGVGFHALKEQNVFWVLSWAKLEITGSLPSYGDSVIVETWAKGKHRLFYMRDFLLKNQSGEVFAKATSAWLLVNEATRGISDLTKLGLELPLFPDEQAIEEYPGKFKFDTDEAVDYKRKVLYSDIDINKHVNNSRYIEFILDCYNQEEHEKGHLKSLTISYKGETHFMDSLTLKRSVLTNEPMNHSINCERDTDGKEIFQCLIAW